MEFNVNHLWYAFAFILLVTNFLNLLGALTIIMVQKVDRFIFGQV